MLKLSPNISDVLEQIRSFAASVIAEVTLFQYNLSDRLLLILLASGSSLNRVFRVLCEIPVLDPISISLAPVLSTVLCICVCGRISIRTHVTAHGS